MLFNFKCIFILSAVFVELRCDNDFTVVSEELEDLFLGGLFENLNSSEVIAFKSAVNYVNQNRLIPGKNLVAVVSEVSHHDSFEAETALCQLLEKDIVGVVGPSSPLTSRHVQSLCDALELPHMTAKWDLGQRRSSCLVNLHPHPAVLAKAVRDIVEAWNWKGFTVLYDDYDALLNIQNLVLMADDKGYLVTVRQLLLEEHKGYRTVLRDVKYSHERNIVLVCSVDIIYDVLIQAQQVGLLGLEYSYVITNLDFYTLDYQPFIWAGTNITTIRMIDPQSHYVQQVTAEWSRMKEEGVNPTTENYLYDEYYADEGMTPASSPATPTSEPEPPVVLEPPNLQSALIHDAVLLFAKAIQNFNSDLATLEPARCDSKSSLKFGYSVINYMRLSEIDGLSGTVKFDHEGFRTDFELEVLQLTEQGYDKMGTWNKKLHLLPPKPSERYPDDGEDLRNVTFIVLIALTRPYNMLKEDSRALQGNDRYEGFGIDLIHELSLMSGFNYTLKNHINTNSGNPKELPNGTRVWDGMIGEVLAGRADLAISDITITDERLKDADFTDPFMNLGISILYRKPSKAPPYFFSFVSPFSFGVWICLLSAYVGVSLLFFVMARISPPEWTNPYPCVQEPEVLENQFSLFNSFWFTVGSLMQQGSDIAPIGISTRLVAAIWWFFTLTMVSSYTAQLASFLTNENIDQPFENVKELAEQNVIQYGAKKLGTTEAFFRDSTDPTYKKIYKFMKENPKLMLGNDEGVIKVAKETNYAFFMESTSIEYEVERKCELAMVNGLLDNKGYGIVMKQNSSYRRVLSKHIVQLQEKGTLSVLKDKWWKEKRGGGACLGDGKSAEAEELSLKHTGGVFVVLLGGCLFSTFLAVGEVIWDVYRRENKTSFKEEFMEELKFIIKCKGNVKPVRNSSISIANHNKITRGSMQSTNTCSS